MTLKIEIEVPFEHVAGNKADIYLASALSAIGYSRQVGGERRVGALPELAAPYTGNASGGVSATVTEAREAETAAGEAISVLGEASVQQAIAKRERGKPSPGRARRTKEEIAEDEAAEQASPNISSDPENRIDPNAVEDSAGTQAQDAADETAEQQARRYTADAPTLDDLRRLMGDVSRKHGMAVAARIPTLLGKAVAEITDDELPGAMAKVQTLLDGDTPAAAAVETAKASTAAATKQDLLNAMYEYADFADGTRDQAKMQFTMVDVPIVFEKLFGVKKLSEVPESGFGAAIDGIREMLAKDPFKRKRG